MNNKRIKLIAITIAIAMACPTFASTCPSFSIGLFQKNSAPNTLRALAYAEKKRPGREKEIKLFEICGGYTGTRQVWGNRAPDTVPAEQKIKYLIELRTQCRVALRQGGTKITGLPTYGYITDMHGDWELWQQHMRDMEGREVEIIVIDGDSMDRADGGVRIMEDIIERSKTQRIIYNLGNHDIFFIWAMAGDIDAFINWIHNWASNTLIDAGVEDDVVIRLNYLHGEYRRLLEEMKANRDNAWKLIVLLRKQTPIVEKIERLLRRQIMNNRRLQNISQWLQANGKVYFIDAYGTFSVHSAVPTKENGAPLLALGERRNLSVLDAVEEGVSRDVRLNADDTIRKILSVCTSSRVFQTDIGQSAKADRLARGLKVLRIIRGHDTFNTPGPANTTIINADINGTAWVMVGPRGISFVQDGRIVRHGALTGRKFLQEVSKYCTVRLKELRGLRRATGHAGQIQKPIRCITEAI